MMPPPALTEPRQSKLYITCSKSCKGYGHFCLTKKRECFACCLVGQAEYHGSALNHNVDDGGLAYNLLATGESNKEINEMVWIFASSAAPEDVG